MKSVSEFTYETYAVSDANKTFVVHGAVRG